MKRKNKGIIFSFLSGILPYVVPLLLFAFGLILYLYKHLTIAYIVLTISLGFVIQIFLSERTYKKLSKKYKYLCKEYKLLKKDLLTHKEILRDQQFVADIQSPILDGDLEDFLQGILPDISKHLEAYQLTLFLSDNHGKLYPKALYKCSDLSETSVFFLDSVEVDLQTGTTQVFKFNEDGLSATEGLKSSRRVLMPMELEDESIKTIGERPLCMKGRLILSHSKKFAARAHITIYSSVDNTKAAQHFHQQTDKLDVDFANVDEVVETKQHAWEGITDGDGNRDLIFTYSLHVPSERKSADDENIIGALKIWKRLDSNDSQEDEKSRKALEKSMSAAQLSIAQAIRKEQVYRKSITDQLTNLYTKRHFITILTEALNNFRRYKTIGTLVLLDIDFFKKFNDTYGHLTGDLVLREVAAIMADACRDTDIPFRYGGEEMAFYLPNTTAEEGFVFADRVRKLIEEASFTAVDEKQSTVKVTVSMGVANFSDDMQKIDDIIALADERLYVSKENGRNQVTL